LKVSKSISFFILLCLALGSHFLSAQSSRNLYGREFWVTFTENNYPDTFNHLIVTPMVRDTIKIYNPRINQSASFPVKPGQQNIIRLPKTSLLFWYSPFSAFPVNTGVKVTSKMGEFALQAVNTITFSTDVTAVIPAHVLGNAREYMVHTSAGKYDKQSQAAVIAMDTGTTTVEFTAGCDLTGLGGKGTVFTRQLLYGQVFVLQALDTQNLTGTYIRVINSCKRIALFSGAKCARLPDEAICTGCDVLFEQQYPTWAMGTTYLIPPVPGNQSWFNSMAALFNNTNITINGVSQPTLNKGEWINKSFTGPALVQADKPISCMQLLKSGGCNGAINPTGDPSLLSIPPLGSETGIAGTSVYRNTNYTGYLVLISHTLNAPNIKINGVGILPSNFQKFSVGAQYLWHYTQFITYNQTWKITADSGFFAYQYGMGNAESYATCIGASFPSKKADFSFSPSPICNPNEPITFTAKGDSLGQFTWFFGDGNSASGTQVNHVYGKTGYFNASIVNPTSGGCTDSIVLIIKVQAGPPKQLQKDTQPCLGTVLRIELPLNNRYKYLWENGNTSFFQSVPSNRVVILKTSDTLGCTTTDTLTVKYRNCNDFDLRLANVFTPNADGFNDEWKVIFKAYKSVDVKIYNRWGVLMYGYQLPGKDHWNGMVNNQFVECPEGVYFYRLVTTEPGGKTEDYNGSIQLIR